MNRAMATVARMNHFAERHSQRVDLVCVSPMVVIVLCPVRAVVTDSTDLTVSYIPEDESRRGYNLITLSTEPCRLAGMIFSQRSGILLLFLLVDLGHCIHSHVSFSSVVGVAGLMQRWRIRSWSLASDWATAKASSGWGLLSNVTSR